MGACLAGAKDLGTESGSRGTNARNPRYERSLLFQASAAAEGCLGGFRSEGGLARSAVLAHDVVQVATVAAARGQLCSIVKHHEVLAPEERFDGLDPVDVHDGGPVDPAEL